jgi:hypothetical protein
MLAMDQTGIYLSLGALGIVAVVVIVMAWWWHREKRNTEIAQSWPTAEATIESGALENVTDSSAKAPLVLPVLAFSYQVLGNYYSGRFALSHINTEKDELIRRMIGRKLQVRYNPTSPAIWYIPDEHIEGCKVEQRIGPHIVALYPKD